MPKVHGKQIKDDSVTATQVDETGTLSTINAGDAAGAGSASGLPRRDHQHAVATGGTTADVQVGDSAAEGASSNLAREDHVHALPVPAAPTNVNKGAASAGTSTKVAREDHEHDIDTAAPVAIGASLQEGSSASVSRADHQHTHGDQAGGSLHADATIAVAGFMSAVDKIKLDNLQDVAGIDAKESCRVRTQANTALSGLLTIDGITLIAGDRVLVDSQSTSAEDGIYSASSGAWTRTTDMATGTEARGSIVHIEEGTNSADKLFQCTNNAGSDVVGTDDLTFSQVGQGSPRGAGAGLVLNANDLDVGANGDGSIVVNANDIQVGVITEFQHGDQPIGDGLTHAAATTSVNGFMSSTDKTKLDGITAGAEPNKTSNQEDVTTQNITGTDTALTDTLNATPFNSATVKLYLNGVKQQQGAGKDYTLSGSTITWLASTGTAVDLETSDIMTATYLS